MQEQRTVFTQRTQPAGSGLVKVTSFGRSQTANPGKTVRETLAELGVTLQPFEEVRVGDRLIDLDDHRLQQDEVVTITNRVVGGR